MSDAPGSGSVTGVPTATPAAASAADVAFAAELASGAGELLLKLRDVLGFSDPKALKAAGDQQANDYLLGRVAAERPGDAVLSEEGKGETGRVGTERLGADRVWIIDPLDGTREYSEAGRDDWAVHVALWQRGLGLTASAVALPAQSVTLRTDEVYAVPALREGKPRIAVSRTRPPAEVEAVAAALGAELVPMGSAGAKVMAVVAGTVDAYVHAGGQFEWDSAAPVGVALASGWHATRIDGAPLQYNNADPYLPDLLVCRPDLAGPALEAIRGTN
ncbi:MULTISPECIES: 3'(2'),5'-bisphosphate nucleotidase CysQ [Glycomyces]|uniref:3'(2'),5-bisphosphonucleoside 3'(2')-phosphohydrolase n=2 Tax=Glycomyces TaxID=58113 RepID=A0A9X3T833_9ACTN|nr:3'(2'),5'-bisphosphate nucleotidase CysQ [Glycomyces lechevalierae]MDA1384853.1 3'(2'),5'-bisphosphate nucleotidase CysQ [Glycomyces lechevalierae]MDR7337695.1 3'(2'), 5'-bisphosphate nucleotidase [Glycomyces lechevalierae]